MIKVIKVIKDKEKYTFDEIKCNRITKIFVDNLSKNYIPGV